MYLKKHLEKCVIVLLLLSVEICELDILYIHVQDEHMYLIIIIIN